MTHLIIETLCYHRIFLIIDKPCDHKTHFWLIKSKIQPLTFCVEVTCWPRLNKCLNASEYLKYVGNTNLERVQSFKK